VAGRYLADEHIAQRGVLVPFTFAPQEIPEVLLIEARAFGDDRGFFAETYKASDFSAQGIPPFVQDNLSHSQRGVLRGLHYQKDPAAQGKLVMAIRGEIFDVAVDIRQGSPTYGKWVAALLSERNHRLLWVPPGFAHGFCVVSEYADVLYKVTSEYSPAHDRGIRWNDPTIGVAWPVQDPTLSPKDAEAVALAQADNNFTY
jgi:dTDP-4-dehydrorhamnose 3,5-epimerase